LADLKSIEGISLSHGILKKEKYFYFYIFKEKYFFQKEKIFDKLVQLFYDRCHWVDDSLIG
jgi:hypothetical protein